MLVDAMRTPGSWSVSYYASSGAAVCCLLRTQQFLLWSLVKIVLPLYSLLMGVIAVAVLSVPVL